jgi:hypothetical protein
MLKRTLAQNLPIIGKVIKDRNTLLLERDKLLAERNKLIDKTSILEKENNCCQKKMIAQKDANLKLLIEKNYLNVLIKIFYKMKKNSSYKIKVGFLVNENQKWNCQSLYDEFEEHPKFIPIIFVSIMLHAQKGNDPTRDNLKENYDFFKKRGMRVKKIYNEKDKSYIPLSEFKPDIIFYQQPWGLDYTQSIYELSNTALCCYVPYGFTSFIHKNNYLSDFHGLLWKYYVETKNHSSRLQKNFKCTNCIVSGYPKFDYFIKQKNFLEKSIWKIDKTKNSKIKRIIYAPHHSITPTPLALSTFLENGEVILDLAKNTPNTEWIFKPHPNLQFNFINTFPNKTAWIKDYFNQWETLKNTQIYNQGDYFDIFMTSDVLITDCGSFLTEYLLTGKPVIHLRTKKQNFPFNFIVKKIISSYYQVYSEVDLKRVFENVVTKNKDPLKRKRIAMISELNIDKRATSASKIISDIKNSLLIN